MMKKLVANRTVLKLSLFIATIIGLSLWVGNHPTSIKPDKPSVPIITTPNTQTNLGQAQVYWLQSNQNKLTL